MRIGYRSIAKLDLHNLSNIVNTWKSQLPYIKPYYAVKSFPNDDIISYLSSENVGFDCASKSEICQTLRFSNDILFANPTKSIEDIKYAADHNVHIYTADSVEEIIKIYSNDKKAKYIIRILGDEM